MRSLNGIKWKESFILHGEKFLLGIVLAFVVVSLVTTRWSAYEKTPEEFQTLIDRGKSAFNTSRWPVTLRTASTAIDPGTAVARLMEGTPSGQPLFRYSTRWVWPLRQPEPRLGEPELLPVTELIADTGKVLLEERPPKKLAAEVDATDGTHKTDQATSHKAQTGGVPAHIERPRPDSANSPPQRGPNVGPGPREYAADVSPESDAEIVSSRGMRFVAVRGGAIPMKQIVKRFRQALNLETPQEAWHYVQLWDFEIERETAGPGKPTWNKDWETIDLTDTMRLLDRVAFDLEVVDDKYRDPVVTMPLPFRTTGNWREASGPNGLLASHPAFKRILTEQEQLASEALRRATLSTARKVKDVQLKQKAGFEAVQHNTPSMRRQMGSDQNALALLDEAIQEILEEELSDRRFDVGQALSIVRAEAGLPRVGPGGAHPNSHHNFNHSIPELLLFRFFDFHVVPGNAYRYRVRLKLKNPNFGRDPAKLLDASLREGRFRHTPWSRPRPYPLIGMCGKSDT